MNRKIALVLILLAFLVSSPYLSQSARSSAAGGISYMNVMISSKLLPVNDPYYGGLYTEVEQGSVLNVSVIFEAANTCGNVGCNLSIGVAFDTVPNYTISSSGYTNASNANPTSTFTALPNQFDSVSLSVTAPATATNLVSHSFEVDIVNLRVKNTPTSTQTLLDSSSGVVGIISPAQFGYWQAYQNYTQMASAYSSVFTAIAASQNNYQFSQVTSLSSQAATSSTMAGQQYASGQFALADVMMTNAMNQYRMAVSSYLSTSSSLASGQTNSTSSNNGYLTQQVKYLQSEVSLLSAEVGDVPLVAYGAIFLGVGVLVASIGVLFRGLRRES
jgi:hypothetical protein